LKGPFKTASRHRMSKLTTSGLKLQGTTLMTRKDRRMFLGSNLTRRRRARRISRRDRNMTRERLSRRPRSKPLMSLFKAHFQRGFLIHLRNRMLVSEARLRGSGLRLASRRMKLSYWLR